MKRQHKIMWGSAPKSIRKQMCAADKDRAVMDYDVKRPSTIVIDGKQVRYEGP